MFFLPHILLFRKYVEYFSLILSFFNLKHSKTIDFSNDFSFDFDPNFDPNFSTLKRFETVQNSIFSLHQTAKNPGNQRFPGFFKYGSEGNRIYVQSPETPMFPCFLNIIRQNFTALLSEQSSQIYPSRRDNVQL